MLMFDTAVSNRSGQPALAPAGAVFADRLFGGDSGFDAIAAITATLVGLAEAIFVVSLFSQLFV